MPRYARGFDTHEAFGQLCKVDRKLALWMRKLGPIAPDPRWRARFDPVDALARAILYQQLSGKAAATIVARVETSIASQRLHCDTLSRSGDATLRSCGVSANKLAALRDLSQREAAGEIPGLQRMSTMHEDAIVEALVPIRGIGRWTVEMMLMFRLGRPDVLPIDDLGIRKGAAVIDELDVMPTPSQLAERGEQWRPFRSYASFYLWRIADSTVALPRSAKPAT